MLPAAAHVLLKMHITPAAARLQQLPLLLPLPLLPLLQHSNTPSSHMVTLLITKGMTTLQISCCTAVLLLQLAALIAAAAAAAVLTLDGGCSGAPTAGCCL